jgi:hypothetical protein
VQSAENLAAESAFERIDSLLLKRMQLRLPELAAHSVISVTDARDIELRTRQLMEDRSGLAGFLHDGLLRDRHTDVLGY